MRGVREEGRGTRGRRLRGIREKRIEGVRDEMGKEKRAQGGR
jgi:hypothetical protein